MNSRESASIDFQQVMQTLPQQTWEYHFGSSTAVNDAALAVTNALSNPIEFPSLDLAIIAGDHVALAVDPNVPNLAEVLKSIIEFLTNTDAGRVDVVLWEEATDETVETLRKELKSATSVTKHAACDREQLRYMGADAGGEAVYLNRLLVDADFVLPVVCSRLLDKRLNNDISGIYPSFADSATRNRHWLTGGAEESDSQVAWMLGVCILMSITADSAGNLGTVSVGVPDVIAKTIYATKQNPADFPVASLVIASIDGGQQQQTWSNVARAAIAAAQHVQPDGTIVLWTALDQTPSGQLSKLDDFNFSAVDEDIRKSSTIAEEDVFPDWKPYDLLAHSLAKIASEHRILLRSHLDEEVVESMGLGVIELPDQLSHLCDGFDSCGVLRAAQFAGSATCMSYQNEIEIND